MSSSPNIPAANTAGTLAIQRERARQIAQEHHTPESDMKKPDKIALMIGEFADAGHEAMRQGMYNAAKREFAKAGAMAAAAIDLIDVQQARSNG